VAETAPPSPLTESGIVARHAVGAAAERAASRTEQYRAPNAAQIAARMGAVALLKTEVLAGNFRAAARYYS